ncbi:chemotaxis protein CheW [Halioxenophilus aromaticivorans]|uniref:Chemotaxis protein CheW n=1 Tax=Halioxenophilus aromaticivorans TaxID=1306992 RepID=A0AAV3U0V7_9ALTE
MEQTPAFQALVNLANRSRDSALGLPAREKTRQEWSGIGFRLLNQNFVVPMGQTSELLEVPNYTRLPNVKSWVRGVANVRGRLLPLYDLAVFLGHRLHNPQKLQRVLVLEANDLYCGLLVDQSFGIQHFLSEAYQMENSLGDADVEPFLLGNFKSDSTIWHVFSMVNLMESPQFMSAARTQMAG